MLNHPTYDRRAAPRRPSVDRRAPGASHGPGHGRRPRTEPPGGFTAASQWFNTITIASAFALFTYTLVQRPHLSMNQLALAFTLTVTGVAAMLLATRGNRRAMVRSSPFGLTIDAVWVFTAILLLPFPLMIVCAGLSRWFSTLVNPPASGRSPITRLMSYISITAISGYAASTVHTTINEQPTVGMTSTPREVIAVLASAVMFALTSHLLSVIAYSLTNSQRLQDQRAGAGLLIEVVLLSHGALIAWAWTQSPAIFFLGLPTLVMVQRALMHERLKARANKDAKTGVASIGWWLEVANREIDRAGPDKPVGVLVIDLDHFKNVNDTFGHLNGDIVLKAVADVLRTEIRPGDKVGRFGGEEFVILLPGATPRVIHTVAERLRVGVDRLSVNLDGHHATLTVSIGGAVYPVNGTTIPELLQHADMNLYQAKRHGRNTVYMDGAPSRSRTDTHDFVPHERTS